jgi:hypothetical protein
MPLSLSGFGTSQNGMVVHAINLRRFTVWMDTATRSIIMANRERLTGINPLTQKTFIPAR